MSARTAPITSPIAGAVTRAITGMDGGPSITAPVVSYDSGTETITVTAVTNFAMNTPGSEMAFGCALWIDGVQVPNISVMGGAAGTQTISFTLGEIGAVAGNLIWIDPCYSSTFPATDWTYCSDAGRYPAAVVSTPTISDTTPTDGDTLTGTPGTDLAPITGSRTYLWLGDDVSLGDTDTSYSVVSGDVGKALKFRVTIAGVSGTSAATSAVASSTVQPTILGSVASGRDSNNHTTADAVAHALSAGSNRLVVTQVAWRGDTGTTRTVNSVTYGGVSMTHLAGSEKKGDGFGDYGGVDVFYLLEADLPANGSNDVVVVMNAATYDIISGTACWKDVNQTSPFGTVATGDTASCNTNEPTVTVSGGTKQVVIAVATYAAFSAMASNDTSLWAQNRVGGCSSAAGYDTSEAASVDMTFNVNDLGGHAFSSGVAILPA